MRPPTATRHTTRRDRYRRKIAQGRPPCHLCGQDIDYAASHLEPLAFTIHHVIPLNRGGPDEMFLPDGTLQIVAAHRKCNRDQGDRMPGESRKTAKSAHRVEREPVKYVTERVW